MNKEVRLHRSKICKGCGQQFGPKSVRHDNFRKALYCGWDCYQKTKKYTGEKAAAEFWAKVRKGERCWIWMGAKHFRGYGACGLSYGDTRAHRAAWKLTNGPIPKGLGVLHKCNTPLCVNPAHLKLGDQKENAIDKMKAGRIRSRYIPVEQLLHPHLSQRGKLTKRASP